MQNNKKKHNWFLRLGIIGVCIAFFAVITSCQPKDEPKEEEKPFAVVSDIHWAGKSMLTQEVLTAYLHEGKMLHLSSAIFNTFADEVIVEGYPFLLISGDLTEYGDEQSHLEVISVLNRIEEAGIPVYVICGNHDIMSSRESQKVSVSQARFATLYENFGYGEAISRCKESLSYSVNIGDKYRLIALDNNDYYIDENAEQMKDILTEEDRLWLYDQTEKAAMENRIPILMSHQPLLDHWPEIFGFIHENYNSQIYQRICSSIVESGATLGFAGHNHANDVTSYGRYTEIQTGCLCYCSCDYRVVTMNEKEYSMETKTIDTIDEKYLLDILPEEVKKTIKENFSLYCIEHFREDMTKKINYYINTLFNYLPVGEDLRPAKEKLRSIVNEVLLSPFYIKDKNEEEETLEEIMLSFQMTLSPSEYVNLQDVIISLVTKIIRGEEVKDDREVTFIKLSLYRLVYMLDENASELSTLLPSAPILHVDNEKLWEEGILECYDSNLVPFLCYFVRNTQISELVKMIVSSVQDDFKSISGLSYLANSFIDGIDEDMELYFSDTEIELEGFLTKAFFGKYVSDIFDDPYHDDRSWQSQPVASEVQ